MRTKQKKQYIKTTSTLIKYAVLFTYKILFNRDGAIVDMWMMQDQIRSIKNWSMGREWYDDGNKQNSGS